MKKKLILFFAILLIILNVSPAFSWVWVPSLVRLGANSAWAAGGSRVMSALVKVFPQLGSGAGIIPAAKTAWYSFTKSKSQLATLAAGTIAAAGASAGLSAVKENWEVLADALGIQKDAQGNRVVPTGAGAGWTLDKLDAYNYFYQTLLPTLANHGSPHVNNNMGIYQTDAEASAAATQKRAELVAASTGTGATYFAPGSITSGVQAYVSKDVTDNTKKFKYYQVGAQHKTKVGDTYPYHWFYFNTGYPGGASVIEAQSTRPINNDDIKQKIGEGLGNDNEAAKKFQEKLEKIINDLIASGLADKIPGTCGAGKSLRQCWDEWVAEGQNTITDDVVADGTDDPTDDGSSPPTESGQFAMKEKVKNRIDSFVDTIKTSGLGGLYTDMFGNIPSSGTCEMSVDMGDTFGGTHTVSFCDWDSFLSILASVMLISSAFVAFRIIMGGGK